MLPATNFKIINNTQVILFFVGGIRKVCYFLINVKLSAPNFKKYFSMPQIKDKQLLQIFTNNDLYHKRLDL